MNAETEIRAALAAVVEHRKKYDDITQRVSHADAVAVGHAFRAAVSQHNIIALLAELDACQAKIVAIQKDADRLDWLADTNNLVGNVQLPTSCVEQNLHSLRAAIDAAMAQSKQGGA